VYHLSDTAPFLFIEVFSLSNVHYAMILLILLFKSVTVVLWGYILIICNIFSLGK